MKLYGKQIITAIILLLAGLAQANQSDDLLILKNEDGTIKSITEYHISFYDDFCIDQGKRLPTARELAIEAVKHGAEMLEVSEFEQYVSNHYGVVVGFDLIDVVNPDGKKDQFYYREDNYKRPAGDQGNYWIWSLSKETVYFGDTRYVGMNTKNGSMYVGYRITGAIRCVK